MTTCDDVLMACSMAARLTLEAAAKAAVNQTGGVHPAHGGDQGYRQRQRRFERRRLGHVALERLAARILQHQPKLPGASFERDGHDRPTGLQP